MRILFLCPKINLDRPSGGTLHYLDLTECMARKYPEHEIVLVASGKARKRKSKNLAIISAPDIDTSIFRALKDLGKISRINSLIAEINPDFVYFRTEPFELFPLFFSGKPGMVEVSYNLFSKSYDVGRLVRVLWPVRNMVLGAWLKMAVSPFSSILVVSDSSRKSLRKRIKDKRILVVRTGVNLRKFRHAGKRAGRKIVFVGNGLKYQGVHLLAEASRILDNEGVDHKILVVGGYEKKDFAAYKSVEILGQLDNAAAVRAMLGCGIGVAPYIEAENEPFGFSPVKVLEYMAAGLAIVATDTEWNREILKSGRNGLFFRSGSAEELAARLKTLLDDEKTVKKMQKANSAEARRLYAWEKISGQIAGIASAEAGKQRRD